MTSTSILFVGGGNMATALIGGMIARGRAAQSLRVVEPVEAQRAKLAAKYPVNAVHASLTTDAVRDAALVVLAVKPQHLRVAAAALGPMLREAPDAIVLSIAAGVRLADLARWLGGNARLVRAMPNTPALVGRGISAVFASPDVSEDGYALASGVLEACGQVVRVADESMLDVVTAVSGSGPAYVLYFLEALEAAARELGMDAAEAHRVALATFDGAIALAAAATEDPATLRAQVTSKGGTTERAMGMLESDAVREKIVAAVKAAAARARELGDAFSRDD